MTGCPDCGEINFSITEQVYSRSIVTINGEEEHFEGDYDIEFGDAMPVNLMCIECGWFVDDPELPLRANLKSSEDLPDEDF